MSSATAATARRLLRPIPQLDGPTRRAWAATQPDNRRASHLLGTQFLVAAALAALTAQFAPTAISHTGSLFGISAAALMIGVYLRFSLHAAELSIDRSITAAILLVAGVVCIAQPVGLTPMLYLWPLLLSAHYALPGRLAANGALAAVTFAPAIAVAEIATPVTSSVIFGVIAAGATVSYRQIRSRVAELFGELEELSSHDPLTGALTSDAFSRAFDAWVGNGLNRRLESSLLLVDVDDFDAINRAHGHEAGDAALRHLASIVYSQIRETDAFGRIDGEEFGLLFPATSGDEAMVAAERIRAAVAEQSAQCGARFTISIGVTGGHAFSDPWAAAARALGLAKSAGANRVVLAETETESYPELVSGELAA